MKRIKLELTEDQQRALISVLEDKIVEIEVHSETTADVDNVAFLIRLQNQIARVS